MKKYLTYIIVGFIIFLLFSILVAFFVTKDKEEQNLQGIDSSFVMARIKEKVLKSGVWREFTENDKITLAFSSESDNVAFVRNYLRDNKIAIFYIYGGPFDSKMEGNYIICTGFDEEGMANIYYPQDNYAKEYKYSFEGLIEFSHKVLTFEM